ncbi:LOW QUALITY PROTEIN: uncharacterized protein C20orf141 homolog [Tenrec ecaudatus]|uniref:LOW QUALITY PROTEIN: uncharacterized protein C20orf141 homolog n=1 Tax=Tenrec ecaudatus TaxID=94439 RepID=UPI003F5AD89D
MTRLYFFRPQTLASLIPIPTRGLEAGEGSGSPEDPSVSLWGPWLAQLLDSAVGLAVLGLTARTVLFTIKPALLLLLLLVSFLSFDLLRRPPAPTLPQHRLLAGGQSRGAGEGPGHQESLLLPLVTRPVSLQDALLLLVSSLGLLLWAHGVPLLFLGLAFCLHPWV